MKKFCKGFTLAEILITLGVIGVVAAMTMPTLIKKYQQHETVNRLKETYSILYNAVRMSETENGLLENWEIQGSAYGNSTYSYGKTFFEQYLKPYIKVVKECQYLSNECWADNYQKTNGKNATNYFPANKNYTYPIVLSNGTVIGFYPRVASLGLVEIYVDLNGKKGPNQFGKDWFCLTISKVKRNNQYGIYDRSGVYMYGQGRTKVELTSNGAYDCSKLATTYAGISCGALIMHDGWKIDKDYPW